MGVEVQARDDIVEHREDGIALRIAIFAALMHAPMAEERLARALSLPREDARAAAESLVRDGLLERQGDRYANGDAIEAALERADAFHPLRSRLLPHLLALALALAVGALALQAAGRANPRPATPLGQPAAATASRAADASQTDERAIEPTFYLVSTPEEAGIMIQGLDSDGIGGNWADIVRAGSPEEAADAGNAALGAWIFDLVTSPLEEARTRDLVASANGGRAARRAPALHVVDLRSLFTLPSLR